MADISILSNVGDLSKPLTVFIEKLAAGAGIIFEPTQVKRMAKAHVAADLILAEGAIQLDELQQRAVARIIQQESRKQKNIEAIVVDAASRLPPDAKVDGLEEDWIAHFFQKCGDVSDREMQTLWSKLLVDEATTPGTFSRRTIDFVSSMDKRDAEMFTKFCQFVWQGDEPFAVVFDVEEDIYLQHGVTFAGLVHLQDVGLLTFERLGGYLLFDEEGFNHISYFGRAVAVDCSHKEDGSLRIGTVALSRVGKELAPICGAVANASIYQHTVDKWRDYGAIVTEA